MEVILDNGQPPRGEFSPLEDWETLKFRLNKASESYNLADDLIHPDVFEMNPEQFAQYLGPAAKELVQNALDNGLYFSYLATDPNTFVHKYKDGTEEVVEYDLQIGKSQ